MHNYLYSDLPNINGDYVFDFQLKNIAFFRVGGMCDVMYYPFGEDELASFLLNKKSNLRITIIGNLSNTLILDGGIRGCVINLSKYMNNFVFYDTCVKLDAGVQLTKFIKIAAKLGISCCEKLYCIPGTIGGAVYMNAGVPGFDISDVLQSIGCIDFLGNKILLNRNDLTMEYRNGNIPKDLIVTSVILKISREKSKEEIETIINSTLRNRVKTQPIGQRTCGSTFKNPQNSNAWKLIKESKCDKLSVGGASVSDIHCNFLINTGSATSSDFVKLIRLIKNKVFEATGVLLEEEIKIMGEEL